jgi:putative membrane-bound dehydrogenase-like protein
MNRFIHTLLSLSLLFAISCKEKRYPDPLPPEKALESFQLREGFTIELFAAEPHVLDPVDMVFDEQGNAFVAEMPDYPFMPEQGKGEGRIRFLQDTDGDGRIDNRVIFADSILEATSMLPWKGGLIVTAAPHILYLQDTDGDFRADKKEILFSGFFENNSEAQITSLRFGVDNWIYVANNGQAGKVTFNRKPEAPPLSMSGADFRFRLDRGEFELETGAAQFGQTLDDWGNRFMTQNTLHIRQAVIPWRYLHRHPHMASTAALINVSDHDLEMFQITPPPYWRAERTSRRQKQYKEQNLDRVEYAEDHFTGSSGGTIYDGDAFLKEYYGNVFTGDVAGNLVHRDILVPIKESPVFVAKRNEAEKTREFLVSTDSWFRPSNFTVGPDGYLYVVDMYRQHIETPLSIPEDLKEDMDFLYGNQHGRIYRILPENHAAQNKISPKLKDLPAEEYVKLLAHPNRWWRLQAQRLLLERQDASVVGSLEDLFSGHEDARTRLHALYALEGLNALNAKLVSRAMTDPHPGVRKHGLILSERYPELLPQLLESINDSSIQVVLQAALSAGEFSGPKVVDALAKVTARYGADRWIRTAVLSSEPGSSVELLNTLASVGFFKEAQPWKLTFLGDFSFAVGSENEKRDVNRFLKLLKQSSLKDEQWQIAGVKGLTKGLEKTEEASPDLKEILKGIKTGSPRETEDAIANITKFYAHL